MVSRCQIAQRARKRLFRQPGRSSPKSDKCADASEAINALSGLPTFAASSVLHPAGREARLGGPAGCLQPLGWQAETAACEHCAAMTQIRFGIFDVAFGPRTPAAQHLLCHFEGDTLLRERMHQAQDHRAHLRLERLESPPHPQLRKAQPLMWASGWPQDRGRALRRGRASSARPVHAAPRLPRRYTPWHKGMRQDTIKSSLSKPAPGHKPMRSQEARTEVSSCSRAHRQALTKS